MNYPIIDLISRINDRNLQKQRESGLTVYAFLGVLGYTIYHLLREAKLLFVEYNYNYSLEAISIVFDIYCILTMIIIFALKRYRKLHSRNFFSRYDSDVDEHNAIRIAIYGIFIILLNTSALVIGPISVTSFYFAIFTSLVILNNITLWSSISKKTTSYTIVEIDKLKYKLTKHDWSNQSNYSSRLIPSKLIIIFFLVGVIYVAIQVLRKIPLHNLDHLLLVLEYSGVIFIFSSTIIKLLDLYKKQNKHNWLLDFEKRIVIEKLPEDGIIKRFNEHYYGFIPDQWVKNKTQEINEHFDSLNIRLKDIIHCISRYKKALDENISAEILKFNEARIEEICLDLEMKTIVFSEHLIKEFKLNQYSLKQDYEKDDALKLVIKLYNKRVDRFISRVKEANKISTEVQEILYKWRIK
jgi:hypothetical protein